MPDRPLRINRDPLRIVPAAERDVWAPPPPRWRCDHEDGRGRCGRRDTRAIWVGGAGGHVEHYCPRHVPDR